MTDPRATAPTVASSLSSGVARLEGLVGRTVGGRYRIVRPLASGGMGSVFVGEQLNLRRPVAIKVVTSTEPDLSERFRREAEALVAVSHPSIVEIFDFLTEPDPAGELCFLVMALVEGQDLADYRTRLPGHRLAAVEVADLGLQAASALVQLHAAGIVHRDIKPANFIRVTHADGRPGLKLVDFGIARRNLDPGLTAAGFLIGTPSYMAPETLLGKPHTPLADVYALGATLYELLTGEPPHGLGDLHEIIKRRVMEPLQLPPDLQGSDLGLLVAQMLDREESLRPTARQAVSRLDEIRTTFSMSRRLPPGTAPAAAAPLPSTVEVPLPRSARPTLVKPPAAPAAPFDTPELTAAIAHDPAPARPRLSWPLLAAAVVILIAAVVVGVILGRRGAEKPARPPPAPAVAQTPPRDAAAPPRSLPDAGPSRTAQDAAVARAPSPDAAVPDLPTVDALVATLTGYDQTNALFKAARAAYSDDAPDRQEYALRGFQALLRGGYTSYGHREWSAKLGATILIKRHACGPARELWRTYQRFHTLAAKQRGKRSRPAPFPACS